MSKDMDKVSVMRCDIYDIEVLDAVVERQFRELERDEPIIRKNDKVVIKPNLVIKRKPEEATTTRPELISAIVRAVKRRGGTAIIAESPGGPYTKPLLRSVYSGTGIADAAAREGAELNFDTGASAVKAKGGKKVSTFNIINPIAGADVIISAAKLKTHCQMTYSGAVKNMFGAVPGLEKPEFHYRYPDPGDFGSMLVDLCETVKPRISFIDGIVAMEGNGPTGGSPKKLGLLFAGTNPYSVDLVASSLIGFEPDEIPLLKEAISRGLCPGRADEVELSGDGADLKPVKFKKPDSMSINFTENLPLPGFIKGPIERLMTPRPAIIKNRCAGCGKCAESCPQHTIKVTAGKAVIDYQNCIKCFCCQEMCPIRAIKVKRFRFFGI